MIHRNGIFFTIKESKLIRMHHGKIHLNNINNIKVKVNIKLQVIHPTHRIV